jgi:hypothetical protein
MPRLCSSLLRRTTVLLSQARYQGCVGCGGVVELLVFLVLGGGDLGGLWWDIGALEGSVLLLLSLVVVLDVLGVRGMSGWSVNLRLELGLGLGLEVELGFWLGFEFELELELEVPWLGGYLLLFLLF